MATPKQGYSFNGEKYPGTTTVISRFKDSGGLLHWAFAQGRLAEQGKIQKLYDKAEEAADIGTCAHAMIEAHINQLNPQAVLNTMLADEEGRKKAVNAFELYLKWEKQTGIKLISKYQEIQLVCPQFKFGGTPDAIGEIDGEIVLLDWKTSNGVYQDYIIQLAAYQYLINNGVRMDDGKPLGFRVSKGAHLLRFAKEHPDFGHHYFGNLDEAWEQFTLFRKAYDIDKVLKKRAA
jgi:hypothetical protein